MRSLPPGIVWLASAAVALWAPSPSSAEATAAGAGWHAPVPGEPVRPYRAGRHPFAGGAHRGVDLAARTGDRVAAACAGRVTFAGAVAGSRVVTLGCGRWRVTHLPLRDVRVTTGQAVGAGERLASLASDLAHTGLHVGVRRAGRRFGYVDPWPLLSRAGASDPPMAVRGRRLRRPRLVARPPSRPVGGRHRPPRLRPWRLGSPGVDTAPRSQPSVPTRRELGEPAARLRPEADSRQPAPPAAWVGLAVLLAGVAQVRHRRDRPAVRSRAAEPATGARRPDRAGGSAPPGGWAGPAAGSPTGRL